MANTGVMQESELVIRRMRRLEIFVATLDDFRRFSRDRWPTNLRHWELRFTGAARFNDAEPTWSPTRTGDFDSSFSER